MALVSEGGGSDKSLDVCEGVLVFEGHSDWLLCWLVRAVVSTENISLWEGVLVLKGQYIHTSKATIRSERIFHFGRVCWS